MLYVLRIETRDKLTPSECKLYGVDWRDGLVNFNYYIITVRDGGLENTIEDAFGAVGVRRIGVTDFGELWAMRGFDAWSDDEKRPVFSDFNEVAFELRAVETCEQLEAIIGNYPVHVEGFANGQWFR